MYRMTNVRGYRLGDSLIQVTKSLANTLIRFKACYFARIGACDT